VFVIIKIEKIVGTKCV